MQRKLSARGTTFLQAFEQDHATTTPSVRRVVVQCARKDGNGQRSRSHGSTNGYQRIEQPPLELLHTWLLRMRRTTCTRRVPPSPTHRALIPALVRRRFSAQHHPPARAAISFQCWSCKVHPLTLRDAFFCGSCGTVQPESGEVDCFRKIGLYASSRASPHQ